MDLIYMNSEKEDLGEMMDYTFDLAFGIDENDFECKIVKNNHCCEAGFYLYYEGSEYGGIIDAIKVDKEEITYSGRTWHGILNSKVLEPDVGEDYLICDGEANRVLGSLIERVGLEGLFRASEEESQISIKSYKMNRYISGYEGIRKMLKESGAKLNIEFKEGFVVLSAKPIVDYSNDEQFDTDQIEFEVKKYSNPINHVICLGKGDLKEREVIHVYADENGNIVSNKSITGILEVTATYDNANAESSEELRQGGIDMIYESWHADELKFDFEAEEEGYDVGDIVGAKEKLTGIEVNAEITKKIVKISNETTIISYKVGEKL